MDNFQTIGIGMEKGLCDDFFTSECIISIGKLILKSTIFGNVLNYDLFTYIMRYLLIIHQYCTKVEMKVI